MTCRGPFVQVVRRALLLDLEVVQQHAAVGHRHRLNTVVRHVDHGLAQALEQALDFAAHLVAQPGGDWTAVRRTRTDIELTFSISSRRMRLCESSHSPQGPRNTVLSY